jgi:hypothetical protein
MKRWCWDLLDFLWAVLHGWKSIVTGGLAVAVLFVVERVAAVTVPRTVPIMIAGLALIAATLELPGVEDRLPVRAVSTLAPSSTGNI